MIVNKLQNLILTSNNMAVPSFTLMTSEIESLKQNGIPKKINVNDNTGISSIPKNESTYTKSLNTFIRKGGSENFTYDNSAPYNYRGNTLNQLPKY